MGFNSAFKGLNTLIQWDVCHCKCWVYKFTKRLEDISEYYVPLYDKNQDLHSGSTNIREHSTKKNYSPRRSDDGGLCSPARNCTSTRTYVVVTLYVINRARILALIMAASFLVKRTEPRNVTLLLPGWTYGTADLLRCDLCAGLVFSEVLRNLVAFIFKSSFLLHPNLNTW
jgi:hypothetical protein